MALDILLIASKGVTAGLVKWNLSRSAYAQSRLRRARRMDDAMAAIEDCVPDAVLVEGLEGMDPIRRRLPLTPIVVIASRNDDETAAEALRRNAVDCVRVPRLRPQDFERALSRAESCVRLIREVAASRPA